MENKVVVVSSRLAMWETICADGKSTIVFNDFGRTKFEMNSIQSLLMLGHTISLQLVQNEETKAIRMDATITPPNDAHDYGSMVINGQIKYE